jgi:hypothetical protein
MHIPPTSAVFSGKENNVRITVDLSNPDNDIKIVGLESGETPESRFGPRGFVAYRLFNAAARLLFLATLRQDKPDIAAATAMQIENEASFVRQRLNELVRPADGRRNGGRR